jgi:deoxycytidine triphosphate deaminase
MAGVRQGTTERERAEYWDTMRRSLTDRANAFSIYMSQLAAANGRGDDGFSRALEMCQIYGEVLRDQVELDWEEIAGPEARYSSIEKHLERFVACERWIDRRFARGIQADVPRALKTIAREQLEVHGLTHHEPVLTVGPPDSFETHQSSLYDYLFKDLFLAASHKRLARHRELTLSIISVPYIEGTTTLWHPITLGHEVAHLRIDATRSLTPRTELMESILDPESEPKLAALVAEGPRPDMRKSPTQVLHRWVDELLCDLNAVRLFGPAGLSAVAEFVGVLGSAEASAEIPTSTHPPLSVRLKAMRQFLQHVGETQLPDHAQIWGNHYVSVNRPMESGPGVDLETTSALVETLTSEERIADLIEHICGWDPPYHPPYQPEAVCWIRDALLDGIPGGTHFRDSDDQWRPISVADVVNGAWAARDAFEPTPGNGAPERPEAGLLANLSVKLMPEHEKRRRIDILASKAVDSVELARLWGKEAPGGRTGIISPDSDVLDGFLVPPPVEVEGSVAGVLSAAPIVRRLKASTGEGADPLIVTPLFANSVHEAGIDVRLGPEFIVFKHSSSAMFDPLADGRDPRMLQESVHMGWGERFFLHPKELVLAATLEYIVLPRDIAAQVVTRSSYGRLGLTTATAVQVQPGSRGCITLELVNHGDTPIALSPGMRVGQLMMFSVAEAQPSNFRRYWFPVGPEFSKVDHDEDAQALVALAAEAKRVGGRGNVSFCFHGTGHDAERFADVISPYAQVKLNTRDVENSELAGEASAGDLALAIHKYIAGGVINEVVITRIPDPAKGDGVQVGLDLESSGGGISFRTEDGEPVEALPNDFGHNHLADAIARFRARKRNGHL